jgi:hypothetical protein
VDSKSPVVERKCLVQLPGTVGRVEDIQTAAEGKRLVQLPRMTDPVEDVRMAGGV